MKNAYVEITNICNLSCDFCPGHNRIKKFMSAKEFETVSDKLSGRIENIFLHVMGEPLLHPELEDILRTVDSMGVKLKITTNGTLLKNKLPLLTASTSLHSVHISVHSFEGNNKDSLSEDDMDSYLDTCFSSAKELAKAGKYAVLRLWNLDDNEMAENSFNKHVLNKIKSFFPPENEPWVKTRSGTRVADRIFLEWGERFEWPDVSRHTEEHEKKDQKNEIGEDKCHGLLSQIGILADGTVVPCCLDRNGDIPLGNIFCDSLENILSSERAKKMKKAMEHRRFTEPLCLTCNFKRN